MFLINIRPRPRFIFQFFCKTPQFPFEYSGFCVSANRDDVEQPCLEPGALLIRVVEVSRESASRRNRRQTGATHYPTSCTLVVPQIACFKSGATGVGGRLAKRPVMKGKERLIVSQKREPNGRSMCAAKKDRLNKNKIRIYTLRT